MRIINYISLFFLAIFLLILIILNKETTRKIAINYNKLEYEIPVYLGVFDFLNRHYNYKHLVKQINIGQKNNESSILNTAKWVNQNIQKIQEGVDLVDSDPLTIVKRRLGAQYQFSDILSVFLVYLNIDSHFFNNTSDPLTLLKVNNHWSVLDPYYGVYFINEKGTFASIEELKTLNWDIANLDSQKINRLDIQDIFFKNFQNYDQVKEHYKKIFMNIKSSRQLDEMNIFTRGGRAYIQKPTNRIRYEIHRLLN